MGGPDGLPMSRYLVRRFGVCDNALAADDFAALLLLGLRSTLLAALAAFAQV